MAKQIYDQNRHPRLGAALARDGYTDVEIARLLGITKTTLNAWKKLHPEFGEALKTGKLETDYLVEDSLLKRALGYDYEETEIIHEEGKERPVRVKRTIKHVPPDVTAQIFWLKNRQGERWRDRRVIDQHGEITVEDRRKEVLGYVEALNQAVQALDGAEAESGHAQPDTG